MKNCVLKSVLALSLAGSFALAQGGFVGVEGGYDFSSKLKAKDGISKSWQGVKKSLPKLC